MFTFYLLGEGVLRHELDGITDSVNLLSNIIGNLKGELVLNGHNQLHNVKRVELQVILEMSSRSNLEN